MTASALLMQSFRLDGRRALVTGAGRGIGLGAAQALAEMGAEVTLVARTAAEIEAGAESIRAKGGKAEILTLDVTDLAAVAAAIAARPPFHVLVNNAGTNRTSPFLEVKVEDFDLVMNLNLRHGLGHEEGGERGSIINMSSQMGHVGAAIRSVYCASKWAMEGMTKAMAVDLAPYGIRVNTIGPTFIETSLAAGYLAEPEFKAAVLSKIKLGRLGQVEDLLGAIVFLASDASSLMTGASLVIDGGWTAD